MSSAGCVVWGLEKKLNKNDEREGKRERIIFSTTLIYVSLSASFVPIGGYDRTFFFYSRIQTLCDERTKRAKGVFRSLEKHRREKERETFAIIENSSLDSSFLERVRGEV